MNASFPQTRFAPLDASGVALPMDLVFIDGFVGETVIGIFEDELHDTQPVRIDLQAGVPRVRACETDRIHDTIDYGVVRERLLRLLAGHRVQLLEALAESIAEMLLREFGAHWVRVAVAKPRKFRDVESVGVVIERRADEPRAAQRADRGGAVLSLIGAGMVPGAD
ncbi:dihydroneopterin aldolase [Caldimonas tepidiphila]|uniref:dihydroneopterin aldolase n=1 Tax=Caldimonas tepidiphila TaxID=2315841 RepID=UPI001F0C0B87|nr:dihydroneopterin aldolase [Caldimonas tepidiphila]